MTEKVDLTDVFKNAQITAIPDKQIGITDKQIIKAYENCQMPGGIGCEGCLFIAGYEDCT